jgi:hypothetical protein
MHCGCWLAHVAQLDTVEKVFHFGGASGEFEDNSYSDYLNQPFELIENGKIVFYPAYWRYTEGRWKQQRFASKQVPLKDPVRKRLIDELTKDEFRELLLPHREALASRPLYITIDKDVMVRGAARQNWNSGVLSRHDVVNMLEVLIEVNAHARAHTHAHTFACAPLTRKKDVPWKCVCG